VICMHVLHCNVCSYALHHFSVNFLKDQEGGPLLRILLESEKKKLELSLFTNNKRKEKNKRALILCLPQTQPIRDRGVKFHPRSVNDQSHFSTEFLRTAEHRGIFV
jgi:hypothetical protein